MRQPLVPPDLGDPAALLAWAWRVRESGDLARSQSLALRERVEHRGLAGPAGDALAQLADSVADHLVTLACHAAAAAEALVGAAHQAAVARASADSAASLVRACADPAAGARAEGSR